MWNNSVKLVGYLGQDPEVRILPTGSKVANINIATSYSYKSSTGEWMNETDWHRVTLFNKWAEYAGDSLLKGDLIAVDGQIRTRSYEKNGEKRYITEINGTFHRILKGKGHPDNSNPSYQNQPDNNVNENHEQIHNDDSVTGEQIDDLPF